MVAACCKLNTGLSITSSQAMQQLLLCSAAYGMFVLAQPRPDAAATARLAARAWRALEHSTDGSATTLEDAKPAFGDILMALLRVTLEPVSSTPGMDPRSKTHWLALTGEADPCEATAVNSSSGSSGGKAIAATSVTTAGKKAVVAKAADKGTSGGGRTTTSTTSSSGAAAAATSTISSSGAAAGKRFWGQFTNADELQHLCSGLDALLAITVRAMVAPSTAAACRDKEASLGSDVQGVGVKLREFLQGCIHAAEQSGGASVRRAHMADQLTRMMTRGKGIYADPHFLPDDVRTLAQLRTHFASCVAAQLATMGTLDLVVLTAADMADQVPRVKPGEPGYLGLLDGAYRAGACVWGACVLRPRVLRAFFG
jgi:hypothetical protein